MRPAGMIRLISLISKPFILSETDLITLGRVPFAPAAEGHGLCPWTNAPAFGRDVAALGREVGCHGLCPWGST